jgi:hypothetical protein
MISESAPRQFLNLQEAKQELQAMGIVVTDRQLRRWADKRILPFFRFGRYLYIEKNELGMYFWRRQLEAIRQSKK